MCDVWSELPSTQRFVSVGNSFEHYHFTHLGVILANDAHNHATARIKTTRRAYYAMQWAGLCVNGSNPHTITHIFKTVVRHVLVYGLECVYQTKTALQKAEVSQAKLLMCASELKYNN